ncbi:MAG: hypothetical protein NTY53_05135 [Kiritimatiellaeota bacterium]|nr:hypothetical protein [Kiritimatiellota bacterium]
MSPFPVTLSGGKAHITAPTGTKYEVLLDGSRIIPITSRGTDVLDLATPK